MKPEMIERIIAPLSYLTMGLVGFVWLLIGLFTKAKLKPFLQYHIFQSIFISILFAVLSMLIGWLSNILSLIPIINRIVAQLTFLLNSPFILGYSLIQTLIYGFLFYLAITSFWGRYTYVIWISDIIDQNINHS